MNHILRLRRGLVLEELSRADVVRITQGWCPCSRCLRWRKTREELRSVNTIPTGAFELRGVHGRAALDAIAGVQS